MKINQEQVTETAFMECNKRGKELETVTFHYKYFKNYLICKLCTGYCFHKKNKTKKKVIRRARASWQALSIKTKINKIEPGWIVAFWVSGQLQRKSGFHITRFIYNKEGEKCSVWKWNTSFFLNRTIKLSLGLNDRMTFWSLEGKHIPFIIKLKIIPYQEGLFSLFWIVPTHKPL